jgi:heparin/heparan-sulfate lyase
VSGKNYPNHVDPARLARSSIEGGRWRLELSPRRADAENLFLVAMQLTDRDAGARWPVRRLAAADRVGCVLSGPRASWAVLLRKDSRRSSEPVRFTVEGETPFRFLLTDLAPGRWQATRGDEQHPFEVDADSGAGWFEGSAGAWSVSRISE